MTNSAGPNQLASEEPTDLKLHCLQRYGITCFSRTRIKTETLCVLLFNDQPLWVILRHLPEKREKCTDNLVDERYDRNREWYGKKLMIVQKQKRYWHAPNPTCCKYNTNLTTTLSPCIIFPGAMNMILNYFFASELGTDTALDKMGNQAFSSYFTKIYVVCLCWGFTAQSTQWGHVESGQFT